MQIMEILMEIWRYLTYIMEILMQIVEIFKVYYGDINVDFGDI